jgi:serine/threonine protein kinase
VDTDRWRRVDKILQDALEYEPHERARFLNQACAEDSKLRRQVEILIRSYEAAGSFLKSPFIDAIASPIQPPSRPFVGQTLGPYEVQALLGSGGMGEVYLAEDTRLGRKVALKLLAPALLHDSQSRLRFLQEARLVATLNHPHICTLYDIGHQNGIDFLIMEYLEGETLAERLQRGPLPLDEAMQSAIEIADALDNAHRLGIIHRDLKPGNIMLTKSGNKVLDFGLAKLAWVKGIPAVPTDLTSNGMVLGTLQYMAPEQLEGKKADARSDIFAFGSVLYEMITGQKAFKGRSQASIMAAILEHDPPPMSLPERMTSPSLRRLMGTPEDRWNTARDLWRELKWVAESLERIVTVCLAKDPENRWHTTRDLRRQLKSIADSVAVGGPVFLAIPKASSRWMVPGFLKRDGRRGRRESS